MIEVLKVLEVVGGSPEPMTVAEILGQTGLASATLTRSLKRLREGGYLRRVGRGRYNAGAALLGLAGAVMRQSVMAIYQPVLRALAERSGLNAELFDLSGEVATFVTHVNGGSEFTPRMHPGHRITGFRNQVFAFHYHFHGRTDKPLAKGEDRGEIRDVWEGYLKGAAAENFVIERGQVRPELARACAAIPGEPYCLGLSGLISEFGFTDAEAKALLHETVAALQKSEK